MQQQRGYNNGGPVVEQRSIRTTFAPEGRIMRVPHQRSGERNGIMRNGNGNNGGPPGNGNNNGGPRDNNGGVHNNFQDQQYSLSDYMMTKQDYGNGMPPNYGNNSNNLDLGMNANNLMRQQLVRDRSNFGDQQRLVDEMTLQWAASNNGRPNPNNLMGGGGGGPGGNRNNMMDTTVNQGFRNPAYENQMNRETAAAAEQALQLLAHQRNNQRGYNNAMRLDSGYEFGNPSQNGSTPRGYPGNFNASPANYRDQMDNYNNRQLDIAYYESQLQQRGSLCTTNTTSGGMTSYNSNNFMDGGDGGGPRGGPQNGRGFTEYSQFSKDNGNNYNDNYSKRNSKGTSSGGNNKGAGKGKGKGKNPRMSPQSGYTDGSSGDRKYNSTSSDGKGKGKGKGKNGIDKRSFLSRTICMMYI